MEQNLERRRQGRRSVGRLPAEPTRSLAMAKAFELAIFLIHGKSFSLVPLRSVMPKHDAEQKSDGAEAEVLVYHDPWGVCYARMEPPQDEPRSKETVLDEYLALATRIRRYPARERKYLLDLFADIAEPVEDRGVDGIDDRMSTLLTRMGEALGFSSDEAMASIEAARLRQLEPEHEKDKDATNEG